MTDKEHKEIADEMDPEYEKLLNTDHAHGLNDVEVERRLERFGRNGTIN
jgi:Cation transporter/ATPase, N-terminus